MVDAILTRLTELRHRRNWSQAEMAVRLDLTEEAYRALEKGRTIRLEWDTILRLLGLISESGGSWEHFFFGSAEPSELPAPIEPAADRLRPSHPAAPPPSSHPAPPSPAVAERIAALEAAARSRAPAPIAPPADFAEVPVLTTAEIGRSLQLNSSKLAVRGAPRLRVDPPIADAVLGVRIEGDALAPEYRDGDVVVCRSGVPESRKPGFLLLRNRECLLCLWHAESNDRIRLLPVDPRSPVRTVHRSEVAAVYAPVRKVERSRLPAEMLR